VQRGGDGTIGARRFLGAAALAFAACVLVVSQLPNVWALRAQRLRHHPELVYAGTLPLYLDDATADWAFMRQAKEGRFLLSDPFTPDPHPRNYVNVLLWSLGTVARWCDADVVAVYNVSKVAFAAGLLALLYALSRRLFARPAERFACFAMLVLSGGWEGPIAFLQRHAGVTWAAHSPGWWMPEIGTLFSMILFPHLVAGFIGLVGAILLMLRAWAPGNAAFGRRAAASASAGGVLFLLTLFHPYDTVTALATLWTAPLLFGLAERRLPRSELIHTAIATAVATPAIAYDLILVRTNPAIRAWDLQNVMVTPELGALVMCFGVNLVLTIILLPKFRSLGRPQLAMLAWLVSVLAVIQLPLRFQRRMMGGLQLPIAALACTAVVIVLVPLLARRIRSWRDGSRAGDPVGWRALALVLVLVPLNVVTPCYVHQDQWRAVRRFAYPSWLGIEESKAMTELDRIAPEGAVAMASYEIGNFIPPRAGIRAFYGHPALTIDSKARGAEVTRFYAAGPEDDTWRRELLRLWNVEYVLYTSRERALGSFDPSTRPWLEEVFVTGDDPRRRAAIYRVR
jgi:hypothetical protein